jgi:hypothetical protein
MLWWKGIIVPFSVSGLGTLETDSADFLKEEGF